jgi:hypothetical protein
MSVSTKTSVDVVVLVAQVYSVLLKVEVRDVDVVVVVASVV